MPATALPNSTVKLNWEALAMWFGRALFLVGLWMGQQLLNKVDALTQAQTEQVRAIETLNRELHSRTSLRWTQIDQRLWATLLAQQNPTIIVPDPKHVDLPGDPPG